MKTRSGSNYRQISASPSTHNRHRDGGAGLGVGKGVVVIVKVEPDMGGNGVKPMVRQSGERPPRRATSAIEPIGGVGYPIVQVRRPQATLVERAVVGHERQVGDEFCGALPHLRESGGGCGVAGRKTVDARVPIGIEVGSGADQLIEFFVYYAIAHDHHPDTANTGTVVVSRFEIYRCEVFHTVWVVWDVMFWDAAGRLSGVMWLECSLLVCCGFLGVAFGCSLRGCFEISNLTALRLFWLRFPRANSA